jgi:D-glycero-alpha-D-manno-heptose-7-phosphate kinase
MIVSKTPFRISFFGGGSDLPSYYNQSPGMVVSATIDKYIYISLNKKFDD